MALCKNSHCMVELKSHFWGEGYCSKHCMTTAEDYDPDAHAKIPHPDDREAMAAELAANADLFDAMQQASAIDARLPKIIYLRRRGQTLRQIGEECGMAFSLVNKILDKCTPNILHACGLRKK